MRFLASNGEVAAPIIRSGVPTASGSLPKFTGH